MDIVRHGTTRRYSDIVVFNRTAYIVEVPATTDADVTTQMREITASLERLLAQAGSSTARILMATVYLRDMADYDAMNAVWDSWLPDGTAPSRACVQAGLAQPGWRVEVALTAAC